MIGPFVGQASRCSLLAVACLPSSLLLPGCTDSSRARSAWTRSRFPDEFAVESRAPLTIPPEFDLRPPQPGAPRPQERLASADKARKVIDTRRARASRASRRRIRACRQNEGSLGERGSADRSAARPRTQQVGDLSLASKLLGTPMTAAAGGAVENDARPPRSRASIGSTGLLALAVARRSSV